MAGKAAGDGTNWATFALSKPEMAITFRRAVDVLAYQS
jgi:hypothetical protein